MINDTQELYVENSASDSIVDRVERNLGNIRALNDRVRAMITVTDRSAIQLAERQESERKAGRWSGLLAGRTVSLKDVIHTAGVRTTNGAAVDPDFVPAEDAEVVRRIKRAGGIIVGKNNLHEFAYGGTTQNPFYGSCRNPWDIDRIPGGSSGGSGAAVAAGMSTISLGTDTAGSGRLPASLCGVSTLRPTCGAIPNRGVTPVSQFFDTINPMARSIADVALAFIALSGHDANDPFSSVTESSVSLAALDGDVAGLTIGIPRTYFLDEVSPGIIAAFEQWKRAMQDLGARFVEIDLPGSERTPGFFEVLMHTDAAFSMRDVFASKRDLLGKDTAERLETLGGAYPAVSYAESMVEMMKWQHRVKAAFAEVDVIAHPTTPRVAPTVADLTGTTNVTRGLARFLYPWSLARVPVISTPIGFAEFDMPCGVSIAAPWHREETLFKVGDAYQRVTDWHLRVPQIVKSAESNV